MFCFPTSETENEKRNPEELTNGNRSNEVNEKTIIQMMRLLLDAGSVFSPADVEIDRQDRLGRAVIHLAAQYGLQELIFELIKPVSDGGFGAN